jgi:hypothetical protein
VLLSSSESLIGSDTTLLEDRVMLDRSVVVGRTLSAYFADDVRNNRLDITYTVYNQQADPISGVLLTDTLVHTIRKSSAES